MPLTEPGYFAAYTASLNDGAYPLTSSDPDPTSYEALTDEAGDFNGINVKWSGENVSANCATSSFTATIMCADAAI